MGIMGLIIDNRSKFEGFSLIDCHIFLKHIRTDFRII